MPSVDVGLGTSCERPVPCIQPGEEGGGLVDLLAGVVGGGGAEGIALGPGAHPAEHMPGGELLQQACVVRVGDGG